MNQNSICSKNNTQYPLKEWLDPYELEQEFHFSRSAQAKMRMYGKIPYYKIGKYVRYKRSKINEWLEAAKVV